MNPDRSARLWYAKPPKRDAGRNDASREAGSRRVDGAEVRLRVWLFGILAAVTAERPVVLDLPRGFTAGDVIGALGARFGREFLDRFPPTPAQTIKCCRIFANGEPVDDLDAPLAAQGASVEFEMILLVAFEGG